MNLTISVWAVLYLSSAHLLADFVLQSHKMAINKSSSNFWLTTHVAVYTMVMAIFGAVMFTEPSLSLFLWIGFNGVAHWFTDYHTSRWSSKYFKAGDFHNGFVVVGIDQYIHLACLLLSTAYLTKV